MQLPFFDSASNMSRSTKRPIQVYPHCTQEIPPVGSRFQMTQARWTKPETIRVEPRHGRPTNGQRSLDYEYTAQRATHRS